MPTDPERRDKSPGALSWQIGTVEKVRVETYRVKTFAFRLPEWSPFKSGQHFDVRLTAPDGYQAQRSYSIASAPEKKGLIELTIEKVPNGEVSPYFHDVVRVGDDVELRGPIGGPFTWTKDIGGPLLLIAGGSGIVPLMSIVRHRQNVAPEVEALVLYSSRSVDDIIYKDELEKAESEDARLMVNHTVTRSQPDGWSGYSRRIDKAMLAEALSSSHGAPNAYVCGPTPLVEAVSNGLVELGLPAEKVRTERFGPSG